MPEQISQQENLSIVVRYYKSVVLRKSAYVYAATPSVALYSTVKVTDTPLSM